MEYAQAGQEYLVPAEAHGSEEAQTEHGESAVGHEEAATEHEAAASGEAHTVSLAAEPVFNIGPMPVTNAMVTSWIVTALLIAGVFAATRKITLVPRGWQNFLETIIEALYNLVEGIAGNRARLFFPLLATFFLFILLNNWTGLLPGVGSIGFYAEEGGHKVLVPMLRAATSDLNTTLALALISVLATQYFGIRRLGILGYVSHYFHSPLQGKIIVVALGFVIGIFIGLLEVISEFVKVVSLSFRLFGNVYAGESVLHTVSGLLAFFAPIPFLMLEVIVGLVQAMVFTMLTLVFMSIITEKHGHDGEHATQH